MSVFGNKRSGGGGGSLSREQCHQGDDENEDAVADADDLLTMMRMRVMMMIRSNVGQEGWSGLCHYPHSTSSPTPRARQPGHSLSTVMCVNVLFYHKL